MSILFLEKVSMDVFLGKRLRELREENHYTQRKLAELLHLNSVTYLHYEKDQREPPLSVLVDIALFYNVSVDYLLGLKDY